MSGRDAWGTDNPERVGGEGEAPSDYQRPERDEDADYERHRDDEISDRLREEGRFGETTHGNQFQEQGCFYSGSLVTDCIAVAALRAHSDFCLTHGISQGSVYAGMAAAFKPKEKE